MNKKKWVNLSVLLSVVTIVVIYLGGLLWLQTFVITDLKQQIENCPHCTLTESKIE